MKKSIFIFGAIIVAAILFYPQATTGKLTGSPGGKTGSPMDNSDCTSCHSVLNTDVTTTNITSNIPSTGYVPGNTYNITVVLSPVVGLDPAGFEVTCEENTTNTKAGSFGITNPAYTQFTNNSSAVTHTTAGNSLGGWSFDWEAPVVGTGGVTFYGAFIESGYPIGANTGDYYSSTTLGASEFFATEITETSNSQIKEILKITDILGRETKAIKNEPLFYIYDDGTVEKKILIE